MNNNAPPGNRLSLHCLDCGDDDGDDDDDDVVISLYPSIRRLLHVVGVSNGLICLMENKRRDEVLLHSPLTRTHRRVPYPPTLPRDGCLVVGFGYHHHDYKVVLLSFNRKATLVYSLRNDSWKLLEGAFCQLFYKAWFPKCRFRNNAPYWFVLSGPPDFAALFSGCSAAAQKIKRCSERYGEHYMKALVKFDLSKEEYSVIQLEGCGHELRDGVCCDALGERCFSLRSPSCADWFEIWFMATDNNTGQESWTRSIRMEREEMLCIFSNVVYPVAYYQGTNKFLVATHAKSMKKMVKLFWYDADMKSAACIRVVRGIHQHSDFPIVCLDDTSIPGLEIWRSST